MNSKELLKAAVKLESDAKKLRDAAAVIGPNLNEPIPYSGTRAQQLEDFIAKKGGGASRLEILEESGIPAGTVASLLGSHKKFVKDKGGVWHSKRQEVPSLEKALPVQAQA